MYQTNKDVEWWRDDYEHCPDCPFEEGCLSGMCMEGEEEEDDD